MSIPSVNVLPGENACNGEGKVTLLHLQQPDGTFRQLQGSRLSGGTFSRLIASRAGIITLLAPALPGPVVSPYRWYAEPATINHRGLFILRTDFRESDWLIAVEDQYHSCDPGWAYHLLMGRLPNGITSVTELVNLLYSTIELLKPSGGVMLCRQFNLL